MLTLVEQRASEIKPDVKTFRHVINLELKNSAQSGIWIRVISLPDR